MFISLGEGRNIRCVAPLVAESTALADGYGRAAAALVPAVTDR
jgi:hypothetical protein